MSLSTDEFLLERNKLSDSEPTQFYLSTYLKSCVQKVYVTFMDGQGSFFKLDFQWAFNKVSVRNWSRELYEPPLNIPYTEVNAVSLVTKLPEKLEGLKRGLGGNPKIRK